MKRPTWATIIGVLGIIFGIFGLIGAGQTATMPKMIEMQKTMMKEMRLAASSAKPEDQSAIKQMQSAMEQMMDIKTPNWFDSYCVVLGIILLIMNGVYVYSSIAILQLKSYSIKLMSISLLFLIAMSLVNGFLSFKMYSSFMGVAMLFYIAPGVVVKIVLLSVIASGKKEAFEHS